MQTIQIEKALYKKLIEAGIDIQNELKKLVNIPLLTKDEILKVVENSQRIEGYEAVSKELELEVEAFMVKYNVQVSA